MKKILLLLLPVVLFMSACEKDDNPNVSTQADAEGNLLVSNYTGSDLLLYSGGELLREVPASSGDFLIHVKTKAGETRDLQLYKATDVSDYGNPPIDMLYKRWIVPLAEDTEWEHRMTWFITEENNSTYEDDVETATLKLSYAGGTENFVDVYLNARTGAKVASLAAGHQQRRVGLDYGNYTLLYKYWYSDPNTADAMTELGWVTTKEVNGKAVDIWLIFNNEANEKSMSIPHWEDRNQGTLTDTLYYGQIEIQNQTSEPLVIYAGDNLIEDAILFDGSAKNMSTIPASDKTFFVLEEGNYHLRAENPSGQLIGETDIEVVRDTLINWEVTTNK